jgi:hypothetical protein
VTATLMTCSAPPTARRSSGGSGRASAARRRGASRGNLSPARPRR